LVGSNTTKETIARLCKEAAEAGIRSISVPPWCVGAAVAALSSPNPGGDRRNPDTTIRIVIGLSDEEPLRKLRQAIRDGARAVDIVVGADAPRARSHQAMLVNLRRLVHEARDARAWVTAVIECDQLTENEQVIAARVASRVRPDVIATGSGLRGDGATVRQVVLLREAAGPGPIIRAMLSPDGDNAEALIDAGAERLGIAGLTEAESTIRSTT
jgi:deoxyribose-phosphate aldolase